VFAVVIEFVTGPKPISLASADPAILAPFRSRIASDGIDFAIGPYALPAGLFT